MPSRRIEQQLEALNALRALGPTPATAAALRNAINARVNVVIAKAAQIAADLQIASVVPDVLRAFDRLFEDPSKTDPQCWGKNAIARALKNLGYTESPPFLRGLRHIQLEPVWGGEEDTACTLRGACALALVQCHDIRREFKLRALVDSLSDAPSVRADAIRAIEQMEGEEAILLLRLKASLGDTEAPVTGQAFESLLRLDGAKSVEFVASFLLRGNEEVREEAALALGASRLASAVEALKHAWIETGIQHGPILLRAISSSRTQAGLDFLIDLVRTASEPEALEALKALELHVDSEEICQQAVESAAVRTEPSIQTEIRKRFTRPA